MAKQGRAMIIMGATAAISVALCSAWAGMLLVPSDYPAQSAYKVPGVEEPLVDRAALQRSWPAGLDAPGGRVRLAGYMGQVERGAVPAPAANVSVAALAPAPEVDLGTRLASADPEKGKAAARACLTCHTFEPGGADHMGPNLWAVIGRDIGSHGSFAYSPAMASHPGDWSYDALDKYLARPAREVPGNKMAFGGIRNPADRANLLAYLGSLGSAAVPKPAPRPAAPGAAAGGR